MVLALLYFVENINLVPFFCGHFHKKILITCPFLVSAPCRNTPVAGVWGAVSDWSGSSWGQSQEDPGWSLLHTRDAEQSHQEVLRRLANESLSGQVTTGPSLSVEQRWCDESKPLVQRCQTPGIEPILARSVIRFVPRGQNKVTTRALYRYL